MLTPCMRVVVQLLRMKERLAEAEEAADLAYMSEYAYNSYMNMMDLAPGYFGGVYDHFN